MNLLKMTFIRSTTLKIGVFLFYSVGVVGSAFSKTTESVVKHPARKSVWSTKMGVLKSTVESLWVEAADEKNFLDPKNSSKIENLLKKFSQLAHELSQDTLKSKDMGATFQVVAGLLDEEANAQLFAFKKGDRKYARHMVKATTRYCSACHTQGRASAEGLGFQEPKGFEKLGGLEQADILVSLRSFEKAQVSFQKFIESAKDSNAIEVSAHRAVNLAVFRGDEISGLAAVNAALENENTAPEFKKVLEAWKKSFSQKDQYDRTLDGAQKYLRKSEKMNAYPLDVSGEVEALRGMKIYSDILQKSSDPKEKAKILLELGKVTERLVSFDIWELPDYLYASCVATYPHSSLARECSEKYENIVNLGYTGSAGVDVPTEIKKRIEKLKQMAADEEKAGPKAGTPN